ncbi:hypothetical protein E2562_014144 [Oryza meyeriana var. granulata]|uniref:Uncharacterized protein n=1 Tax=Oryza meyeriana var. granulata TaxID=110450 RepID=A0A6G1F8I4_9ORYZ|nr:hypothetical protein E2562_014144 [Oryza meyeriana var. granulata]
MREAWKMRPSRWLGERRRRPSSTSSSAERGRCQRISRMSWPPKPWQHGQAGATRGAVGGNAFSRGPDTHGWGCEDVTAY